MSVLNLLAVSQIHEPRERCVYSPGTLLHCLMKSRGDQRCTFTRT